jgi:LysM repeat protein
MALIMSAPLAGCEQSASIPESEEVQLSQEAERLNEPETEEVEVLDDERSVERRLVDATLAAKVRLALVDVEALRPFNFEAVAVNGRVLLRGEVETQDERTQAESVAQSVEGVRDVINEISAAEEPIAATSDPGRDSLLAAMEDAAKPETSGTDVSESADAAAPQAQATTPPAQEAFEEEVYHTVRSGDSLWEIARSYSVSVDQITRLNNLPSNRIKPGQRLRIR